ncbi:MAG: hypothetical protein WCN92_00630 [Eubacteriales bacterium]
MLFTDPEYQFSSTGSGSQNIFSIVKSLIEIVKINPYLFAAFTMLMSALFIDKKRAVHKNLYLLSVSVIFVAYIAFIVSPFGSGEFKFAASENLLYCTLPLSMVGIICYILSINKDKQAFTFLWILGILYAVCLDITSDLGTLSSIQAFAVLDTASVIFIKNLIDELKTEKEKQAKFTYKQKNNSKNYKDYMIKSIIVVLFANLLFQICFEAYININIGAYSVEYTFGNSIEKLTKKIQAGPLKGVKTAPKIENTYNNILSDLSIIKQKAKGPVLIVDDFEWPYLYLEMPFATYSTYLLDWNLASRTRLPDYYRLHPEKEPKYIYISKFFARSYLKKPDPAMAKNILDDILDKYNCTVRESSSGYMVEIKN